MLKGKRIIAAAIFAVLFVTLIGIVVFYPEAEAGANDCVFDTEFRGWYEMPEEGSIRMHFDSPLVLKENASVSLPVSVEQSGKYNVYVTYKSTEDIILKSTLTVEIEKQGCMMQVTSLWRDEDETYPTDGMGNELPANQVALEHYITDVVCDQASVSVRPFVYDLGKGKTQITLTSHDVALTVSDICVSPALTITDAASYRASLGTDTGYKKSYRIEGEKCSFKSDSSIRATSVRNPALTPYDYRLKKCNVLDAASFQTAGQKVQYVLDIESDGIYNLSFCYSQDYKEDIPVYRNVLIDSKLLCSAFESVPFYYTGSEYQNLTVGDEEGALGIYLTAGRHTVTLVADGTPVADIIERLSEILSGLSSMGVEIKKVSGGEASEYRTWDIEEYLPGLEDRLKEYRSELLSIYKELGALQQENPAAAVNTKLAADNLTKLLNDTAKIPGKLELLNEGSGSATQFLADQIDKLSYQNLSIDKIYIHSPNAELPNAKASALSRLVFGIKRLFASAFFEEDVQKDEDAKTLTIWVNRSIQYVDMLQSLADSEFTKKYGIKVKISVMSSEQRVILANASNSAPDLIMGVNSGMPFDLGIRGAVVDLTEFDDFAEYITKEYSPQSLVPYVLGDGIYGVTETQEFYVLMQRKDVLDELKIKTPVTWDDVEDILPILRRNSMNFYLQLSGYTGTKPMYSTLPFLRQSGGEIYAEDGMTTAIQSNAAYKGFETLTDLYRLYSVQKTVSSFYNSFRYGQIPIGISSFSDYVKIKNAAPEITGLWEISLAPGFEDENGEIHRGTTGVSTGAAIMQSSDLKEEAWTFLKWWLSSEVQQRYGNSMQMTYGADYLWNTANIVAFEKLAFPEADKKVILEQWEQMDEIYRHPALYAVEREISNAWNNVVIDGTPARIALDNAASEINREFRRKLEEFGYLRFTHQSVDEILAKGKEK